MCSNPGAEPAAEPAIRLEKISKRFGPLWANRDVDLTVQPGTVHALVGENGAGKSTLMKILAGVLKPDAGVIWLGGERMDRYRPAKAIKRGLGMVYQHFMLIEPLTVAENLILGREPVRRGLIDMKAACEAVEALGRTYDLPLAPGAVVGDLSVGERQKVELLKVLWRGARIVVLDEPTAVLTPAEVEGLFRMLHRLVAVGLTVIFITHKLDEVMAIADRVTVMRRGEAVAEVKTAETTPRELAHLMVGREVVMPAARRGEMEGEGTRMQPVLALEDIEVRKGGRTVLDGLSLALHPGEVLGIAGVQGNGQSELLEAIVGLRPIARGSILLGGREITGKTVRERFDAGLAHIPEDRQSLGLVLGFSVAENLILGRHRSFRKFLGLDLRRMQKESGRLIERFDIRPPSRDALAGTLSGGNQQKVVVARELSRFPRVLLAGQPTRGVDIGAVAAIHEKILQAREKSVGVLLVSSDLGELLALSDRLLVMNRGRIVARLEADEATPELLGELMTGADGPEPAGAVEAAPPVDSAGALEAALSVEPAGAVEAAPVDEEGGS